MITVSPRARRHTDRAGDPLDGLVNMFDVGIVLAVGFLLAALASLHLSGILSSNGLRADANVITTSQHNQVRPVPSQGSQVVGRGKKVGTVYRLANGQLVYVVPKATPAP